MIFIYEQNTDHIYVYMAIDIKHLNDDNSESVFVVEL